MMFYVQYQLDDNGWVVIPIEGAGIIIDELRAMLSEENTAMVLTAMIVEMEPEEKDALPEFTGW